MKGREAEMGLGRLRVTGPARQFKLRQPPIRMKLRLVLHDASPTRFKAAMIERRPKRFN
jgi:hypothetical protein